MSINFETGSSLSDFQQALYNKVLINEKLTDEETKRLKGNCWVKLARWLAPSNLVIRHLCLLDLVQNQPTNYNRIVDQIKKLTYWTPKVKELCWAESYSYWLYTKPFLITYKTTFNSGTFFIEVIDSGFQKTAYFRDGVLYPALFGDLRDVPLEDFLQDPKECLENVSVFPVTKTLDGKGQTLYTIKGVPIGLNAHIPKVDSQIIIKDGYPIPFIWYADNGATIAYRVKYPTKWLEYKDVFDWRRIKTIPRIL
jgi:hypothetical protein